MLVSWACGCCLFGLFGRGTPCGCCSTVYGLFGVAFGLVGFDEGFVVSFGFWGFGIVHLSAVWFYFGGLVGWFGWFWDFVYGVL